MTNEEIIMRSVTKYSRMCEWLAQKLVNYGFCPRPNNCTIEEMEKCNSKMGLKCWIKAARKSIQND